jgi:Entner-Doudoroff aldolase
MTPDLFVETLWRERASAILRTDDADVARAAMNAAVAGGFRIVEFTLTTPDAYDLIAEFSSRSDLVVGAGTVLLPEHAQAAVAAGARFLVSPVADETVIRRARELGVAMMPGVHTPNEMVAAHQAGAPLLKVFPGPAGGPSYIRSCLGPLPFLRLVPTNAVDESNVTQWLDAGAWGVGFVTSLFAPQDLAEGNYRAIEARARTIRRIVDGFERPTPLVAVDPLRWQRA